MKSEFMLISCGLSLVIFLVCSGSEPVSGSNAAEDLDDFAEFDDDFEEDEFIHRSSNSKAKHGSIILCSHYPS